MAPRRVVGCVSLPTAFLFSLKVSESNVRQLCIGSRGKMGMFSHVFLFRLKKYYGRTPARSVTIKPWE